MRYQGLYNGQNYVPQNEQSGANQNIHANIWIVYYTNISVQASPQIDSSASPTPIEDDGDSSFTLVEILREEECVARDE